jgi:hypothetical protein
MSDDTDMNAQVNPGVATTEVTVPTVPQVGTTVHAPGGTGNTPPGYSPKGEDTHEEGSASSDMSDLVLDNKEMN